MLLPMGLPEGVSVIAWGLSLERYNRAYSKYTFVITVICQNQYLWDSVNGVIAEAVKGSTDIVKRFT